VKPAKADPESTEPFAKGHDISIAPTGSLSTGPQRSKTPWRWVLSSTASMHPLQVLSSTPMMYLHTDDTDLHTCHRYSREHSHASDWSKFTK
jgi:hypothetical protein